MSLIGYDVARPRSAAGEIGSITVVPLEGASGGLRLRARVRNDAGLVKRLNASGATYEEAFEALREQASLFTGGMLAELRPETTVAELCEAWLDEVRSSRENQSTIENYEATVRTVVIPTCGSVRIKELSIARLDQIVRRTRAERSLSAAKRLRKILSMALGLATRYGVLQHNPVRDIQRLPGSAKKESFLTQSQLQEVRRLASAWVTPQGVPRIDRDKLLDVANIIVGTSGRIGEVLALQRRDIDLADYPGTVHISATLQQTKANGLVRKPTPKFARQARVITIPEFAREALVSRLNQAGSEPIAYLFATRSGLPYSVSNFQRLMRAFKDDHWDRLLAAGIEPEKFTTHIFRRTAATTVERHGGITLASRLLGHSDESITRASYVVTDEKVDRVTAGILDKHMG